LVTIALRSSGGALEHLHVKEDLSSQADGYNLVFTTTFEYEPGTLIVYQAGLAMLDGYSNDFTETGPKEFTWVNDLIGAPDAGCSLWAFYQRTLP
jgi:hypothetical protein